MRFLLLMLLSVSVSGCRYDADAEKSAESTMPAIPKVKVLKAQDAGKAPKSKQSGIAVIADKVDLLTVKREVKSKVHAVKQVDPQAYAKLLSRFSRANPPEMKKIGEEAEEILRKHKK